MNIVKESIAETSKLKLVKTILADDCYFEILVKRKNEKETYCYLSKNEEEARKTFNRLKRQTKKYE